MVGDWVGCLGRQLLVGDWIILFCGTLGRWPSRGLCMGDLLEVL